MGRGFGSSARRPRRHATPACLNWSSECWRRAQSGDAMADVARFLLLHYRHRFSRAQAMLEAAAAPVAALGFGVCVGAVGRCRSFCR